MNILITGNQGYLGTVLTRTLLDAGHEVTGYDIVESKNENKGFKQIIGDLRDFAKLDSAIKDSDVVIHLAAIVRTDNPVHLADLMKVINTEVPIEIAKICQKYDKKMIFASTCSVYGLQKENSLVNEDTTIIPTTIYAKTKLDAENILKGFPNVIICRIATAYGHSPNMRYDLFINEQTRAAFLNNKIILSEPHVWRPYLHTEDISKALLFIAENKNLKYRLYNIGDSSQNLTKQQIVDMIKEEIPMVQIIIEKSEKDTRDYKVDFSRLASEGFKAQKSVKTGIKEILNLLSKNQ